MTGDGPQVAQVNPSLGQALSERLTQVVVPNYADEANSMAQAGHDSGHIGGYTSRPYVIRTASHSRAPVTTGV
jgi:hypothetical protein